MGVGSHMGSHLETELPRLSDCPVHSSLEARDSLTETSSSLASILEDYHGWVKILEGISNIFEVRSCLKEDLPDLFEIL